MKLSRLVAARKYYEAMAAEAKETIEVYLTNSVGIGEHPQIMEELRKQIELYASANDCITNVDQLLDEYDPDSSTQSSNPWEQPYRRTRKV